MISGKLVIVSAVAGVAMGYFLADNIWQSKWDRAEKQAKQNQLSAVNEAVQQYQNRIKSLEVISRETTKKLNDAKNDAAIADNAANSLQQQLSDFMRKSNRRADSTTVSRECAAIATDLTVLAELFSRADKRAGELAAVADESRVRGSACELAYDSLADN